MLVVDERAIFALRLFLNGGAFAFLFLVFAELHLLIDSVKFGVGEPF